MCIAVEGSRGVLGLGHFCQHANEIVTGLEMPFASNVSAMVTSRTHSFHVGGDGVSTPHGPVHCGKAQNAGPVVFGT